MIKFVMDCHIVKYAFFFVLLCHSLLTASNIHAIETEKFNTRAKVGTNLTFIGTGVKYSSLLLQRIDTTHNYKPLVFIAGNASLVGAIISTNNAKKSYAKAEILCKDYYNGPEFTKKYLVSGLVTKGVGLAISVPVLYFGFYYAWGGEERLLYAGIVLGASSIIISDVLFTIQAGHNRKVVDAVESALAESKKSISLSLAAQCNSRGAPGVAMVVSF